MILLTAYITLAPDKVAPALDACRIVRAATVKEPGCDRYDFWQSPDDPAKIVFVEEWQSKADLDLHMEQAAFKQFMATIGGFVQGPPTVRIVEGTPLA